MAVDTRNKRSSAIGAGRRLRRSLPLPDGNVSKQDRRHLSWLYAGLVYVVPLPPPGPIQYPSDIFLAGHSDLHFFARVAPDLHFVADNDDLRVFVRAGSDVEFIAGHGDVRFYA